MLRIAIIDDEYFFRSALKSNMPWKENDMEVAGDANDGPTGLALILREKPDVAIVDINMPMYNGLELIRRAQNAGAECRYIILTGYEEFKYAQSAVSLGVSNYVLKPVDFAELMSVLTAEKEKLRRERLKRSREDDLRAQARKLQFDRSFVDLVNCRLSQAEAQPLEALLSSFSSFRIALFSVGGIASAEDADQLRDQLRAANLPSRFRVFIDGKNRLAVLFDTRDNEETSALLAAISRAIEAADVRPDLGVGRGYSSFEQIYLSYNEALIAIRNHFIYSELAGAPQPGVVAAIQEETRGRLRRAVGEGRTEEAEALLRDVYKALSEAHAGYDQLVLTALDLMSLLISILDHRGVDTGALLGGDMGLIDRLERFQSVPAFSDWTIGLYAEGIRRVREQKSAVSGVTQRVIAYIDAYLSQSGLTINRIARALYLNYSYICVSFKKDMGLTVNEYILRRRIARARELFENGAMNVSLVAEQVGFDDPNYFSKCFRKNEGMSPSDFVRALSAPRARH